MFRQLQPSDGHNRKAYRNVDDIYDIVRQLSGIICCKIIAATLHQQYLAAELGLQCLECPHVGANIFTNSRVRAATSFNCKDARRGEGLILDEELLIFLGKDIVRHSAYIHMSAKKGGDGDEDRQVPKL